MEIETAPQRRAAHGRVAYWDMSVAAGSQSCLGQEEALEAGMQHRPEIAENDHRVEMNGRESRE